MHRPHIHEILKVSNRLGLVSVLAAHTDPSDAILPTHLPNVSVIPAGPLAPDPSGLLQSEAMKRFMSTIVGAFDHVIFDSPPVLAVSDAVLLAHLTDGAILCVRAGSTSRDKVARARDELLRGRASVLGVVLNSLRDVARTGTAAPAYRRPEGKTLHARRFQAADRNGRHVEGVATASARLVPSWPVQAASKRSAPREFRRPLLEERRQPLLSCPRSRNRARRASPRGPRRRRTASRDPRSRRRGRSGSRPAPSRGSSSGFRGSPAAARPARRPGSRGRCARPRRPRPCRPSGAFRAPRPFPTRRGSLWLPP